MSLIFALLLLILSVPIFLYKDGKYYIEYIYIWLIFGPVFFGLFFYVENEDFWIISTWCKRSLLVCYGILIFSNKKTLNHLKIGLLFIFFIIVYYAFLSGYRGAGIMGAISYICGCFLLFITLPILLKVNVEKKTLVVFLNWIFWIELIIGVLQYFYPPLNYGSRIAAKLDDISPIGGTLYGNNTYIEFLMCLWYCMMVYQLKRYSFGLQQIIQTILFLFLLIQCGIRVSIIAAIPLFSYLFIRFYLKGNKDSYNKKRLTYTLIVTIFGIISILGYLANLGVTYTSDATSGMERNLVLLSIFLDNSYLIQQTTFGLSYDVFNHLSENYIFGPGLLFQGNGYDGYINMEAGNVTDATLAIYVCETGIIGAIFFITFLINRFKFYCKIDNSIIYLIFALLLLTITDSGIMSIYNLLVLYTMIVLNDKKKRDQICNSKIQWHPKPQL